MKKLLANFVSFQLGWFACVLTMANGRPFLGIAIAGGLVAIHIATARNRARESAALIGIGCLGAAVDTSLAQFGWVSLSSHSESLLFVFGWFVAFWANFATTLTRCMSWLHGRLALAVAFGALGGPPAYFGAQALGALSLPAGTVQTIAVLATYWAIATPTVLWLAHRINPRPAARVIELAKYRSVVSA